MLAKLPSKIRNGRSDGFTEPGFTFAPACADQVPSSAPRRLRRTAGCTRMGVSGKAVDVAVGRARVMTIVRLGGRRSRLWLTAGLGGKLLRVRGQAG